MSRILWLGNPPTVGTGYGEQAALFVPRLKTLGHEVAVQANFGVHWKCEVDGITYYPSDPAWGNATLATFAEHFEADLVIALCDAWVLKPDLWPAGVPRVAVWAPIDHDRVPSQVFAVLAHERISPIAMSRFGERAMRDRGLEPLYVPHGVDTTVFRPRPELRDETRDELGLPRDAFVVGMVAANKGTPTVHRKAFPQAFDAFARFAADHDDVFLYCHSESLPVPGSGINLHVLADAVGIPPQRIKFTPKRAFDLGIPASAVAQGYQAFDVLLMPSMGEGFGIPLIEAQACGVPVITSDHSAMTELGAQGWLIGGDRFWDPIQESFWICPSIAGIHAALEDAYLLRGNETLRAAASEFASAYDADLVTEKYWKPALEHLLSGLREVAPLNAQARPNRAQRRAMAKAGR